MAKVPEGEEKLPKILTGWVAHKVGCTNVTDRQTTYGTVCVGRLVLHWICLHLDSGLVTDALIRIAAGWRWVKREWQPGHSVCDIAFGHCFMLGALGENPTGVY